MQKAIETTGKTIDDAIAAAMQQLKLDRDSISVEVLEKPKAGFLGLGGTPARIRATYESGEPEPVTAPVSKPVLPAEPSARPKTGSRSAPAPAAVSSAAKPRQVAPVSMDAPRAERATAFLTGLLEHMNADASAELNITDEGFLEYTLTGSKTGMLIGRRGETLDAMQHLVSNIANRGEEHPVRVTLDAEGYRQKREASLIDLAQRTAAKAVKYRRNIALEPMNSYARHVIHTALQNDANVSTHSVGSEPNRRVVISVPGGKRDSFRR